MCNGEIEEGLQGARRCLVRMSRLYTGLHFVHRQSLALLSAAGQLHALKHEMWHLHY